MKIIGALVAALALFGVIMGALGAHALSAALADRGQIATWETAVLYHLVHAVAAFAVVLRPRALPDALFRAAAGCWLGGILLFSGSLYVLALGGPRWLGRVTPLGGVALISGWLVAGFALFRSPGDGTSERR